jgi:HEPN domain-containing protein
LASEITRADLQKLADEKLSDARIPFNSQSWSNAYYLAGYAVELAIKACIAKSFKADTVPDKDLVMKTYSHEFPKLIGTAELTAELQRQVQASQDFGTAWGVVNEWTPDDRYRSNSAQDAKELIEAIGDATHGVLAWIKTHW